MALAKRKYSRRFKFGCKPPLPLTTSPFLALLKSSETASSCWEDTSLCLHADQEGDGEPSSFRPLHRHLETAKASHWDCPQSTKTHMAQSRYSRAMDVGNLTLRLDRDVAPYGWTPKGSGMTRWTLCVVKCFSLGALVAHCSLPGVTIVCDSTFRVFR